MEENRGRAAASSGARKEFSRALAAAPTQLLAERKNVFEVQRYVSFRPILSTQFCQRFLESKVAEGGPVLSSLALAEEPLIMSGFG